MTFPNVKPRILCACEGCYDYVIGVEDYPPYSHGRLGTLCAQHQQEEDMRRLAAIRVFAQQFAILDPDNTVS